MKQKSRGTILLVDDIGSNRVLLKKMVALLGYKSIEASDGSDAVKQFEKHSPDLILMDIHMPIMNGYEAAAEIKKSAGENHVPIIFVTALSADLSFSQALESGGDDYVNKPVDIPILESKIAAHLRIRDLNQKLLVRNQEFLYEQKTIEHFFNRALNQSHLDPRYINYHLSPMSAFNGDILLTEKGPNGSLYVLLGDFTGHGLRAAMGTLPTVQAFFPLAQKGVPVGEIAKQLNQQLRTVMPTDMFCAATLLELDRSGRRISAWCGGMPDAMWISPEGEFKDTIRSKNMPLGILPCESFCTDTVELETNLGDQFYLYSDGIVEAGTAVGEAYGEARLQEVLTSPTDKRFERALDDLTVFREGHEQEDDITFVELTCIEEPDCNNGIDSQDTVKVA